MDRIKKRILIAEDTYSWQRFHIDLLRKYDNFEIELFVADSARQALDFVYENINNPFDLVFTDLQMESDFLPKMAGEWFVEQLLSFDKYKKIPIVIVSAAYNISFIADNLGVNYLSKRTLINSPDSYYFLLDEKLL